MADDKRRYWAIRTDRENRKLLLEELRKGRPRQGWGYDPSQDLRLIQAEIVKGGPWWDRLSPVQKEVLPQRRMLAAAEDSVQPHNWVVVPNLPDDGMLLIGEIAGEYYYEPLKLSDDTDVNGLGQDYGHVLPFSVLTPKPINRYAGQVPAGLRGSLRTPMRMWCLDSFGSALGTCGFIPSWSGSGERDFRSGTTRQRLEASTDARGRGTPQPARFRA